MHHVIMFTAGVFLILALIVIVAIIDCKTSDSPDDLLKFAWSKGCLEDSLSRALLGIPADEATRRLQLLELQGEEECIKLYKNRLTNEFDIKQARAKQLNAH